MIHRVWVLAAITIAIAGCATPSSGDRPTTLAELDGTAWRLVSLAGDEAAGDVTLRFDDTKVSGRGACNGYFGSISAGGAPGSIAFGPIGATRMSCGEVLDAAETRFLTMLGAVTRFSVEHERLILGAGGGDDLIFEPLSGASR